MRPIRIGSASRIEIGYDGENSAREIVFDATQWMIDMPGCTAAITAERADGEKYVAPDVTQDDEKKTITWTLTRAETMEGEGRAQLLWMDGERIAKQAIFTTVCHESLKSDATEISVPEPVWAQKSLVAAQEAKKSAEAAAASATGANNALEETKSVRDAAKKEIDEKKESAIEGIENAKTEAIAHIETEKDELAPPIICEKTGTEIIAKDSADRPLREVTVYGKSTQETTPTESNPVEILSVGGQITISTSRTDGSGEVEAVISAEGGLRGVPDLSGTGTYTDDEGKAWIADTIEYDADAGTRKIVRRVGSVTFDGDEGEKWTLETQINPYLRISINNKLSGGGLCTHYNQENISPSTNKTGFSTIASGNRIVFRPEDYETITVEMWRERLNASPVTVFYALDVPDEKEISAEEMEAFAALRSRYPETKVMNDAGAYMRAAYIADTKKYVDDADAEMAKAILEVDGRVDDATKRISEVSEVADTAKAEAEEAKLKADENGEEIGKLKGDFNKLQNATATLKKSTNLYNEANAQVGYRCVGGGGITTQDDSVLSEFIEIPDGMTYAVPSAYYNGGYRLFCYSYGFSDENKENISGSGSAQTSGISIPDGAKYFRCSWITTTTSQRFINFNNDGALFPYEEYHDPIYSIKTPEEVEEKLNDYEKRISDVENTISVADVERVICWGDSLTDGAGASDTKHQYPYVLKSLIDANNTGIVTDSAGQGGEGTYSIATRQGGVVVNVKPCTIPSSGSVNVEVDKWNGLIISLCRRGRNDVTTDNAKMKINPCYIAGVKGTLLRDSNSNYVFKRTEDGEEVTFTRPMPLLTDGHETYNGVNEVAVIWSGTNDIASNGGTIEKTIQGINMMIAKLKSKKYIVVGLTSKAYHSDIDDKNFRMATEYKDNFVNVRDYMLTYGLEDYEITPTEQDLTDISNGEIPTSLRVDNVHGNDYFYDIVAKQVYKKGQELGYWN